tara:strand:+ start:1941 stop:2615 length:675 start_codon:yes stop_codon:yes gene_type:complete
MVWTTPRNWVANELVTADTMNTHIKDNFGAVSLHTHSGAAGDGASALANVDTVTFDHQGSDPSAPASGHGTVYFKSDGLYFRNTGGAATRLALSSDNLAVGQIVELSTGAAYDMSTDSGETDSADLTITAGGSGRYYVASAVIAIRAGHVNLSGTFKFYFDGSVIETETRSTGQVAAGQPRIIFNQTVTNPAASAKVFKVSVEGGGSGSCSLDIAISIREIYTS